MTETLKIGDRFSSFADVKVAIEELGEKTFTTFWKRDARTIASSKIVRRIESDLVYYQLVYACNHGGKKFKSSGKQIRKSWTYKEDCPVHVRFKASADGKALEVTSFQSKHNHDTSKILHAHAPGQRRLTSNINENVKDYLTMRVNQKLQESIEDLTNVTKNDDSKKENLDDCIDILKSKYGAYVAVFRDENNHFRGFFIQTPTMKNTMNAFPEFLAVDATYKLLKIGPPTYLIIVEDGNCQTEIVAVGILSSEDKESFTWFLETFKRENPAWSDVKFVMTDRDLTEKDLIRNYFPGSNHGICVFHTLKIINRDISCKKLSITPNQRTLSLELIQKMVYSKTDQEYEEYLEGLKNSVPSAVYEYFMENWNSNKDDWNLGKDYFKNNFLNNANNRLESICAKLKSTVNKNSSLDHFINSLFTIISSLETERDHKTIHGILKKPVDLFPEDSDEKQYFELLTRGASKLVLREIRLSRQIENITSTESYYTVTGSRKSTQTTTSSCSCVIFTTMNLPCKHIFALRKHLQVNLFDPSIVNRRWTMAYYKDKQRTLTYLLEETPSTSNNNIELNTYSQRRKRCMLLCAELADLAAQRTGVLFEQRLNVLKSLKALWTNDVSVAIAPNDENDLSLEPSEICNAVLQDINESSDIDEVLLDNGNLTPWDDSHSSEVCNEGARHQNMNEVSDLWTIKMPASTRKRGRPIKQDVTITGLPTKKTR